MLKSSILLLQKEIYLKKYIFYNIEKSTAVKNNVTAFTKKFAFYLLPHDLYSFILRRKKKQTKRETVYLFIGFVFIYSSNALQFFSCRRFLGIVFVCFPIFIYLFLQWIGKAKYKQREKFMDCLWFYNHFRVVNLS